MVVLRTISQILSGGDNDKYNNKIIVRIYIHDFNLIAEINISNLEKTRVCCDVFTRYDAMFARILPDGATFIWPTMIGRINE